MSRIKTVQQLTSKTTQVTCNAYDSIIQTVPLVDALDTSFTFQVNNSVVQDISTVLISTEYPTLTGVTTRAVTLTGTSGTANVIVDGVELDFNKATLENAISAFSAVAIILKAQYGDYIPFWEEKIGNIIEINNTAIWKTDEMILPPLVREGWNAKKIGL